MRMREGQKVRRNKNLADGAYTKICLDARVPNYTMSNGDCFTCVNTFLMVTLCF